MISPYRRERRKLIIGYLDRYPDAPSRTLARMIFRDIPEYFRDEEHARSMIRIYRGKSGSEIREKVKFNKYYKP